MLMTKQEICRSYLLAISKPKQIRILAELNDTSRDEIIKILTEQLSLTVLSLLQITIRAGL